MCVYYFFRMVRSMLTLYRLSPFSRYFSKLFPHSKPRRVYQAFSRLTRSSGTVGLSLGYPGLNTSFSAKLSVVSKLVIIAMQIRGRHRGLPYELDRAVSAPCITHCWKHILTASQILLPKEQRDAEMTSIRRRSSNVSTAHPFPHTFSLGRPVPSQAVED
jgi:hypothetical protein